MENNFKAYNLGVLGIDKTLFLDPFYSGKCERINFSGVIKEYKIQSAEGTDYISLAPKFIPHSDFELMLQSTDSICKSPITSLTDEAVHHIFGTAYKFIEFMSDQRVVDKHEMLGGYPYFVYNYDEFTTDRHSGMSKKPFHLHLNSWKNTSVQNITPVNEQTVSPFYYKSLFDPIFNVAQILTKEALDCEELKMYVKPVDLVCGGQNIFYSSIYEVINGWSALQKADFAYLMKTIHRRLEARYIEILSCFCGNSEIPALYTRHNLLPKDEIINNILLSSMQDATKEVLKSLIEELVSISPEQFQKISQRPNYRDTLISLRWLAYSIGMFSNSFIDGMTPYKDKKLYINVTPRLFTKIGGASIMNFPKHALVKIDRGIGNVTSEEFGKKLEFNRDFTKFIK